MVSKSTLDLVAVENAIDVEGFAVVNMSLSEDSIVRLRRLLIRALDAERQWHGVDERPDENMVLVCPLYGTEFSELLAESVLWDVSTRILGADCIAYAFTSSSMPPGGSNFSRRIHNDCPRETAGFRTNLGVTIALDEFTEANGATEMLVGSHKRGDRPEEHEFLAGARRFLASPGQALVFDARLWHRGGVNRTSDWRHAVTVNFCRPWMKQRLDLPRLLGEGYRHSVSSVAAQRLGYEAQVPASYFEYYQPPHRRPYRVR
jgi:ectoine hydroxylase-related dioxygenase (phytanoyl-CoA dioxygenase family)